MRLIAACLAGATAVSAQAPAPAQPTPATFEVASVKLNKSATPMTTAGYRPGGGFVMVNGTVAALIGSAYPDQTSELIGAPAWIRSDRYDVTAQAQGNPTRDEMRPMLRALLADRFKLAVHYETREQPVYALVRSRSDGRLGPDIRRSDLDCAAVVAANRAGRPVDGRLPANGAPPCGMLGGGGTMRYGGVSMASLARSISSAAGRVVVDKTGLDGNYEVTLRYSTEPLGASPDDAPSIFTAVQEQLWLKLESTRGPVEVLVIDSVERPTPD